MIRSFIAIPVPASPQVRRVLQQLSAWPALRVTDGAKLHLTLAFLGDTDEALVPKLAEILRDVTKNARHQEVTLKGLGVFPRIERPTVVWVGMADINPWVRLAELLAGRCEELGFTRDSRPYQPHVTLARVRSKPPQELAKLIHEQQSTELGSVTLATLDLFESELGPSGPAYTCLHSESLVDGTGLDDACLPELGESC